MPTGRPGACPTAYPHVGPLRGTIPPPPGGFGTVSVMPHDALHPSFRDHFDAVLRRNPGESEFQQAVYEVMVSLAP